MVGGLINGGICLGVVLWQILWLVLPPLAMLPAANYTGSLLATLWQVHAAMFASGLVLLTLVVTILGVDVERERTWSLYLEETSFSAVVLLNGLALLSEGLALVQTHIATAPLAVFTGVPNLLVSESILFVLSLCTLWRAFQITIAFLNPSYVEAIWERRIIKAIERDFIQR